MPDPIAVNSMFARIARRYDVANRLLSLGMDRWWRARLVKRAATPVPNDALDLATGSGDVAFALARKLPPSTRICGMDFCQPMLDEADIKKAATGDRYRNIEFKPGDGMSLPVPDQSVDVLTISFGLRNMADRHKSLTEMRRVLRPGGKLLVLEFSQPQPWFRPFYFFYLRHILPKLAGIITGDRAAYDYLNRTIEQFPNRTALTGELQRAGFNHVTAISMTFGIVALHEAQR